MYSCGYLIGAGLTKGLWCTGLECVYGYQRVPVCSGITPNNVNDIDDAWQMKIESGVTYVFDKCVMTTASGSILIRKELLLVTDAFNSCPIKGGEVKHILGGEGRFNNRYHGGVRVNEYQTTFLRVYTERITRHRLRY